MRKRVLISFIIIAFYGCQSKDGPVITKVDPYFDLKTYINTEADRLSKANLSVDKTVAVNGLAETKKLKIVDWKSELSIFSNTEINRASWKGLFKVESNKNLVIYRSDNDKVPVKELCVFLNGNHIKGITAVVKNSNLLYTSIDSLSYFADSAYQVKKQQDIRFLAKKTYLISGKFTR
ncbi:hypothetical protein ACXZ1K_17455 [Pedobacter sp. PWIIR3]